MATRSTFALAVAVIAASMPLTSPLASAQLWSPNAKGVALGHVHINTADVETQARFWGTLGGEIIKRDTVTLIRFPGVFIVLRPQEPTGGSVGSTLNHIGLHVRDFAPTVAKWKAAGVPWEPVTTNPAVGQGFITGPDKVRVEIYEDTTIPAPVQIHHLHLVVPNPSAAQRWYVDHFGAVAGKRMGGVAAVRTPFDTAVVSGAEITLSRSAAPLAPTRGRSFDHVGFEVTDIDRVVAALHAAGIKTDGPVRPSREIPGVRSVLVTDPWGVDIEVTQGLGRLGTTR